MKKSEWRQRLRGTCKWSGVMLCALLFVIWITSRWYEVMGPIPFTGAGALIFAGVCKITGPVGHPTEWPPRQFEIIDNREGIDLGWRSWDLDFMVPGAAYDVEFPLWLPFLIIALPTGFLFWSDHKRGKPGHCAACGYSLTGNSSGTCPECGATTPARAAM